MKSNLLLTISLCISVLGNNFALDTNNICKYTICKMNNDSAFHQYNATVLAKSRFDSLVSLFRTGYSDKDTSLKHINKVSGGLFTDANNYMTYPIMRRTNEIIEDYCINNNIDIFIIYPPCGIQYAHGETNDFPDPADSVYIKKLLKCSIADVTDTIIQRLNNDPEIINIRKNIDKVYKSYKKKMRLKIDTVTKIKNKPRVYH